MTTDEPLTAPMPYAGGKRAIAAQVWREFGVVDAYCEPFAGSLAVLLQRPEPWGVETVNDVSGFVTNVWRAIRADPDAVADLCDDWINEVDLMARHLWLVNRAQTLTDALIADPDYYDAKAGAWWVWGASSWIGSGWCNGDGPWVVEDGKPGPRGARRK